MICESGRKHIDLALDGLSGDIVAEMLSSVGVKES